MAYGVKYRITFSDDFPNNSDVWENITQNWESYTGEFTAKYSWQLDLLMNGYSGSITNLTTSGRMAGSVPLVINGRSNDDDPLYPILPTEIISTFYFTSLFEFDELFSGDERQFQFKLYLNSNLELTGWMTPDGSIDFYADTPYPVSVRGLCGLEQLKGIPYDNDGTAYTGTQTLLEVITNCLDKTELGLGFYTAINFYEENMNTTADVLGQIWIDADTWTRDGETMSCYDVLLNIGYRCNATFFQREGKWYFVKISQYYQDVDNILRTSALEPILTLSGEALTILGTDFEALTGFTRYEYHSTGVLIGQDVYKPNVSAGGAAEYQLRAMNQDQIVMIRQPWKKATINYDHEPIPNIVIDGGFEPENFTDSGTFLFLENWDTTGIFPYVGVYQDTVQNSEMGLQTSRILAVEDTYEAHYISSLPVALFWDTNNYLKVSFKYKFADVGILGAKLYFALKLVDDATSTAYYFGNGFTAWSVTPTVYYIEVEPYTFGEQTDFDLIIRLPLTFFKGTLQFEHHGHYDGAVTSTVIIDNLDITHYDSFNDAKDSTGANSLYVSTATTPSILSIEGSQDVVIGEGRTNYTKGAFLMDSAGATIPGTWARVGKTETKSLDEVNLQSIMNIRYYGNKIIEGSYRGYPRYGDVIIHHGFDNRYFMVKKFNFNAKMRKATISMHEVKDIDNVTLVYDTIIS